MPALSSIIAFLLNPKSVAVALVGLLAVFGSVQTLRLRQMAIAKAEAQAALIDPATKQTWKQVATNAARAVSDCNAKAAQLQAALDRQNAAVANVANAARLRTELAEQALAELAPNRRSAEQAADAILRAGPGADTCASALDLIRTGQPTAKGA